LIDEGLGQTAVNVRFLRECAHGTEKQQYENQFFHITKV
jgi:hypothetical protein